MTQPIETKEETQTAPRRKRRTREEKEAQAANLLEHARREGVEPGKVGGSRLSVSALEASHARAKARTAAAAPRRAGPKYLRAQAVAVVCDAMRAGSTLADIWRNEPRLPTQTTFRKWLTQHEDSRQAFDAALAARAQLFVERVSDTAESEPRMIETKTGGQQVDAGYVAWQRFRFDAHRWIASKLIPQVYGDNVRAEITGADGGPLQVNHSGSVALPSLDAFAAKLAQVAARREPVTITQEPDA